MYIFLQPDRPTGEHYDRTVLFCFYRLDINRAKGDDFDRFIAAPPSNIEKAIEDYFDKHPELKSKKIKYDIPGFLGEHFRDIKLEKGARELEKMNKIMIDRELKRVELKKELAAARAEIAELEKRAEKK